MFKISFCEKHVHTNTDVIHIWLKAMTLQLPKEIFFLNCLMTRNKELTKFSLARTTTSLPTSRKN